MLFFHKFQHFLKILLSLLIVKINIFTTISLFRQEKKIPMKFCNILYTNSVIDMLIVVEKHYLKYIYTPKTTISVQPIYHNFLLNNVMHVTIHQVSNIYVVYVHFLVWEHKCWKIMYSSELLVLAKFMFGFGEGKLKVQIKFQ